MNAVKRKAIAELPFFARRYLGIEEEPSMTALRHSDPQGERRFNALLHRMAPREP